MTSRPPSPAAAWRALRAHARSAANVHLRTLFARDTSRFTAFSVRLGPLLLDYSKNRVTAKTMALLADLARRMGVEAGRAAMFAGGKINATEGRAAFHVALRDRSGRRLALDGVDVAPEVQGTLARLKDFAAAIHSDRRRGATGMPIRHIVNIGIGGSHLGPMFVTDALKTFQRPNLSVAFVSNPDRAQIDDVLVGCDPAATLFVVASKTFTTVETMSNARIARAWIAAALGDAAVAKHFAAVSTNLPAVRAFGIAEDCVFPMWDWVGGRYSVWSAIGLPVILACGFEVFARFLAGAHDMDRHFETAGLEENIPVLMALIGVWNADVLGHPALAILPYDHRLRLLPHHLQQLDMESSGKGVDASGRPLKSLAGPILFGGGGSDSQHSFFQFLHQSPRVVPCDFIIALKGAAGFDESRDLLVANALAQTEALMRGRTAADLLSTPKRLRPHRAFSGNRPSNTILLDEVNPEALGMLLAAYEHKVFVQGLVWGINSFDQWGVELGKELASRLASRLGPPMSGSLSGDRDASTQGLLKAYLAAKRRGI